MSDSEENDLLYVCSLIEYTARVTCNRRSDVVKMMGKKELAWQLEFVDVSHCLPFEQTADELIDKFDIQKGSFDSIGECKYDVPSYIAIGGLYRRLITQVMDSIDDVVDVMYEVFCSFISDEVSNFNSSLYYNNPDYIKHSYLSGRLLP